MQLMISDANILIDMEEGGLLDLMFSLPYRFTVPNIVLERELHEMADRLTGLNIETGDVSGNWMKYAMELRAQYKKISIYDSIGIALAKQEQAPLLTGDLALRKVAQQEAVIVKGTLWLVEQLIVQEKITVQTAEASFSKMKAGGRRLPWPEIELMLANYA